MKQRISATEAFGRASHWLKENDGERDWAVADVREFERGGHQRQDDIIEAVDLIVRRHERKFFEDAHGRASNSDAELDEWLCSFEGQIYTARAQRELYAEPKTE